MDSLDGLAVNGLLDEDPSDVNIVGYNLLSSFVLRYYENSKDVNIVSN